MKVPELKSIHWISPPDMGGENVSSIQRRYMEKLGWNTKSENPALIYCGSESQLERAVEAKNKFNVPVALNFWGWLPERFRYSGWKDHYASRLKLIESCADFIIAPSRIAVEQLWLLGCNKGMYICQPGTDTEFAHSIISEIKKRYLLSIGRLVPHKQFDLAIAAISKSNIPIEYVIIGDGPEYSRLIETASSMNVRLTIFQDSNDEEKFIWIKNALALICPSAYEGFGMPVVEAATLSIPVLAFELASNRELFDDCPAYFRNVDQLASLISRVHNDDEFRKLLSQKISFLGIKYSGFNSAAILSRMLSQEISSYIKKNLSAEFDAGRIGVAGLYDIEAKLDEALFPYRLRADLDDYRLRLNFLLEHVCGKDVLDFGCSNGIFSVHLAARNHNVVAFDCSKNYLDNARKLALKYGVSDKITFKQGGVESLNDFRNEMFDSVWAGEIIEHFQDSSELIRQLIRILKVGGRLIFSMPYKDACLDVMHKQIFNSEEDIKKLFRSFDNFEVGVISAKLGSNKNWVGYGTKL